MILNNAADIQSGSTPTDYVYHGETLVWSRGTPPVPPVPILDNAINVILLGDGDARTETVNYFYTIEDLRTFMVANGYPKRYEVIFGDTSFDALAKYYEPGYYVSNREMAYKMLEESHMKYPFGTVQNEGRNANVVFLTLGEGFRKIYNRGSGANYPTNVCTIGKVCGQLRELRLPSTMTDIDNPYYSYNRMTNYSGLWGGNIEKVYIAKASGSISGEPWDITSQSNSPNAQIIWTG